MAQYRKAAALGSSDAMIGIGQFYERGLGVPRDYAQAMTWYQRRKSRGISMPTTMWRAFM